MDLLTLFFFIFVSNMMGLIAVFPGGANVMGNMSITLVLALCTFVVINVSGTKEYWKEIFWPDVPMGLKCPVPLLPVIEIFGVFTKPVALMINQFEAQTQLECAAVVSLAILLVNLILKLCSTQ